MTFCYTTLVAGLLSSLVVPSFGQELDSTSGKRNGGSEESLEDTPGSENLLDQILTEAEQSPLLDELLWLQEHPLDLNKATQDQLEAIPGIHPAEAMRIVRFRKLIGKYTSLDQLQEVEWMDENLYRKLKPYVTVEQQHASEAAAADHVQLRSRVTHDLQPRRGFQDGTFAGSALKSYSRLTVIGSAQLQGGALFEKDPGERFGDGFSSGYVACNDLSFLSTVVLGDFVFDAGQGLAFSSGVGNGKGGDAVTVAKKPGIGIQPFHSSDESHFLRGGALGIRFFAGPGTIHVTTLISRRSLAASPYAPDSISSFYDAGLFRTSSELDKRNGIRERLYAGRLQYSIPNGWNIGATYFHSTFDKIVVPDRNFEFSGASETTAGIDATAQFGMLTLFGEAARSGDGAGACIVGSILALAPQSTLALLYRDYSTGFNNLHAHGFGENGNTHNERGLYFGTELAVTRWLSLSGYIDHFKFPWRTFSNPVPTSGNDILLQADAEVLTNLQLSARYCRKSVEGSEHAADSYARQIAEIVSRDQERIRITATYRVSQDLRVRGRLETTRVSYALSQRRERGMLFFQDVHYSSPDGLAAEARLVFFDTDSFDSRVYEYESDIRGVFSNPALYGKGRRWYLVLRYTFFEKLDLSAKYSETQKDGVSSMGTGTSEIMGDLDNRISIQVDLRL